MGKSSLSLSLPLSTTLVLRILFFFGLWHSAWAKGQQCYYPNQKLAVGHVPCSSAANSACCSEGAICLSNSLCLNAAQPYALSRGSCTDSNWLADACPKPCRDVVPEASCVIELFTNMGGKINYCCNAVVNDGKNSTMCMSNMDPINLEDSSIIPGRAVLGNLSSSSTSPKKSQEIAIGVGLGVPLAVIAVTAALWGFWERAQRRKLVMSQTTMGSVDQAVPIGYMGPTSPTPFNQEFVQKPLIEAPSFREPVELDETVHNARR